MPSALFGLRQIHPMRSRFWDTFNSPPTASRTPYAPGNILSNSVPMLWCRNTWRKRNATLPPRSTTPSTRAVTSL